MQDRTGEVYEWLENGEIFVIVGTSRTSDKSAYWLCLVLQESVMYHMDVPGTLCTYNEEWFSSSSYRTHMRRIA
jgi:hypothetical protein